MTRERFLACHASLVEVNADHWKTWIHERLSTPQDAPGAMTFFHAPPRDHYVLARQLTAEKQVQVSVSGKGDVIRWERVRRNNHYLDCAYNAAAAAHAVGVRLLSVKPKAPPVTDYFKSRNRPPLVSADRIREFRESIYNWQARVGR